MRIKLYSEKILKRDKLLYGKFYLYDVGIFTLRLNPKKVIEGINGLPKIFGMDIRINENAKAPYLLTRSEKQEIISGVNSKFELGEI